jgi:hypothetical protein
LSPRTTPLVALTDRTYWRQLLAVAHPDRNDGDGSLFVFLTALQEHILECTAVELSRRHDNFAASGKKERYSAEQPERVPYDAALSAEDEFYLLTHRALSIGQTLEEPFRSLFLLLLDYCPTDHGRRADR